MIWRSALLVTCYSLLLLSKIGSDAASLDDDADYRPGATSSLDHPGVAKGKVSHSIRYVRKTYRRYIDKDVDPAWRNTGDRLVKKGFSMQPVGTGVEVGANATALDTPWGTLRVHATPDFVKQELYSVYKIPTPWPYCEGLKSCTVYTQTSDPEPSSPMDLVLPPGTGAVDFYLDVAIDCVTTLRAHVVCDLMVQPGNVDIPGEALDSICSSPFVGRYFGFYTDDESNIERITIKCKSAFPTIIGLLRVGRLVAPSSQ